MAYPYPYHSVPSKLERLFRTIQKEQVPPRVTRDDFLRLHGFKSSNDDSIPKILRMLGFTNEKNIPTEVWRNYRGSKSKTVMAEAIRNAYPDLFASLTNPYERRDDELANYFKIKTGFDETKVRLLISTFQKLCSMADFLCNPTPEIGIEGEGDIAIDIGKSTSIKNHDHGNYSINLNIQLQLPETTNTEVYEKLFESVNYPALKDVACNYVSDTLRLAG